MKKALLILPALYMSTIVVACGEAKKLDDMHDATLEMRDTTKQLLQTSNDMKATTASVNQVSGDMNKKMDTMVQSTQQVTEVTKQMAKTTDRVGQVTEQVGTLTKVVNQQTSELYDASRQGVSLDLRRGALKEMVAAHSSGKKVAEAGKYFMSFEFQLWNGLNQDESLEKRESLLKDAASELFKDIKEFDSGAEAASTTAQSDGLALTDAKNKDAGFNALAAALHRVNRKQEEMHQARPDVPVVSMLSLIQESLKRERELAEGKIAYSDLTPAHTEILVNRKMAIRLLQARHNFVNLIFLKEVSPIGDGKIAAGKAWLMGWNLDLDKYTEVQVREFTRYLRAIKSTRDFLVSVGIKPELDSTVASFMKGLSLKTDGKGVAAVNAARVEFVGALEDLKPKTEKTAAVVPEAEPFAPSGPII